MVSIETRRSISVVAQILFIATFIVVFCLVGFGGYQISERYQRLIALGVYLVVLGLVVYQLRFTYLLLKTPDQRQKFWGLPIWIVFLAVNALGHFINEFKIGTPADNFFFSYLAPLFAIQSLLGLIQSILRPMPIPGPSAEPDGPGFEVIIESYEPAQKIAIIQVVRKATTLGLKDAKDLVEAAPKLVKKYIFEAEAETLKQRLEEAGATVKIESTTGLSSQ